MKMTRKIAIAALENERDNAEAGEMLEVYQWALQQLAPRIIVVETSGGVVDDVHGLRQGDQWDLADWDEKGDYFDSENAKLIAKAKAQK